MGEEHGFHHHGDPAKFSPLNGRGSLTSWHGPYHRALIRTVTSPGVIHAGRPLSGPEKEGDSREIVLAKLRPARPKYFRVCNIKLSMWKRNNQPDIHLLCGEKRLNFPPCLLMADPLC
ncbi:unnamed protein product [Gadus morhua 'NCC']